MKANKHPTEKLGRKSTETSSDNFVVSKISAANKWLNGLNRNTKLSIILAFALIIIGAIAYQLSNNPKSNNNQATESQAIDETDRITAKVKLKEGTLQIKDAESDWADIDQDTELSDGSDIRTVGATSKAVLLLPSGTEIRIDANTEINIEILTEKRIVLQQKSGYLYNRIISGSEQSYTVKTNDAQFQSDGTAFETIANGDEQSVKVFHNQVIETSTNKTVSAGEKFVSYSSASGNNSETEEKTIKLDIEELKKDQFIMWNRDQDLANEVFKSELGFLSDINSPEININSPAEGSTILIEPTETRGGIEFSGTTERGSKLTILAKSDSSAQPVNITLGDNGSFTSPLIEAPSGDNVFEFVSKDKAGNTTTKNYRLTIQPKSQPVATSSSDSILLTMESDSDSTNATWVIAGSSSDSNTVQLIYSKNQNPKFGDPGAQSKEVKNSNTAEIKFNTLESGKTYYFVACIYDKDSKCTTYSTQKSVNIP